MRVRLGVFPRRRSSPGDYSKRTVPRCASVISPRWKLEMDDNKFRWPNGRPKRRQAVGSMSKSLVIGIWCFKIRMSSVTLRKLKKLWSRLEMQPLEAPTCDRVSELSISRFSTYLRYAFQRSDSKERTVEVR